LTGKLRVALAALTALGLAPGLIASPTAQAGPFNGTALTNFDRATPGNAAIYITVQSTSAAQTANVTRIGGILGPRFSAAVNGAAGGAGGGSSSGTASITAVLDRFKLVFNGEYALAALLGPGKSVSQESALIELGLQPGMTAQGLGASLALLGMTIKSKGAYHGIALQAVDLGALAGVAGGLTGGAATIPSAGGATPSAYLGVLGNDAVVGTNLQAIKSAVDAYTGAAPSVDKTAAFAKTVGKLPSGRFMTTFVNVTSSEESALSSLSSVAGSKVGSKLKGCGTPVAAAPGSFSVAAALSAEPDGILFTTSPVYSSGSLATMTSFKGTSNAAASLFPGSTIGFASLGDLGTLASEVVLALSKSAALSSVDCAASDPFKAFTTATGLDLNNDVLSWMHGELSVALLPVGSPATYKDKGDPLAATSVVIALKIQSQSLAQAKLTKIIAALNLHGAKADRVKVIVVPGPGGVSLHVASRAPGGLGYAFYKGYLLVSSSLGADLGVMQKGGAGATPALNAALSHFGSGPYSGTFYLNLTNLRLLVEKFATASGTDMKSYNSTAKPLLEPFKSLSAVIYANNGATAEFIGIGK